MDYSVKIGGEAGQGIQTIGDALARVFTRNGFHVFSHQDYESRIRGGHNFYQLRFSTNPVSASQERVDILVAMDRESIVRHEQELLPNGRVLYDSSVLKMKREGSAFLDIPFEKIALAEGGGKIMANTVATGAVLGMLGMELAPLLDIIATTFQKKGVDITMANRSAAVAGHEAAVKSCAKCSFGFSRDSPAKPKLLIGGAEAIALGAIASGCKFYSAYPMTPSTGIMNYLAAKEKEYGIVVEQAEDEIAAINMSLGASFAGVRAMTGTSGGGFALMTEGLSLAGMTETPIVIAMGQRPGPATGFPTRTEQGELQFILSAGHGEFPRIVFAPGTPRQAFHLTNKAFDLAEKYQVPAFILFDTYLSDAQWAFDGLDAGKARYTDYRLRGEAFSRVAEYKRHAFSENGISPFGVPGDAKHVVVTDSDEHDEEGHIVEDALTRVRMVEKRFFKKLPLIRREVSPPFLYGDHVPRVVLVGWGSTYGVLKEAVDRLSSTTSIAMLHFSELFPFPLRERFDYLRLLASAKISICIEGNASGQFANLMRAGTGHEFTAQIHKFDGRPFLVEELVREIRDKSKI
jgi:2-oxoglutarate/2-oxoacid ferredoxin oxidoreductase subunit alpha